MKAPKEAKEPPKKKARKEKKDGPKRGQTSFLYFSKDKRAEILAEHPGLPLPEVSKKLGELWKAATAEDKVQYEDLAKTDKERYEKEKADWPVATGSASASTSKKQKATTASSKTASKGKRAESPETADEDESD